MKNLFTKLLLVTTLFAGNLSNSLASLFPNQENNIIKNKQIYTEIANENLVEKDSLETKTSLSNFNTPTTSDLAFESKKDIFYNNLLKNLVKLDEPTLKYEIRKKLEQRQHITRKKEGGYVSYSEASDNVNYLSYNHLNRIYLLLNELEDPEFCGKIMNRVNDDFEDTNAEYGGLVNLDEFGIIEFRDIPSELERNADNNNSYNLPALHRFDKRLFEFHVHAVNENNSEFAGPSPDYGKDGDLDTLSRGYPLYGESYQLVITKIKNRFNVDFYSLNLSTKLFEPIVLDLGVYPLTEDSYLDSYLLK